MKPKYRLLFNRPSDISLTWMRLIYGFTIVGIQDGIYFLPVNPLAMRSLTDGYSKIILTKVVNNRSN